MQDAHEDEAHLLHTHEPVLLDPTLTWAELIETTVTRFPRFMEMEARRQEAGALAGAGSRLLSAAPSLTFGHLNDAPLDDLDQREFDFGIELPLWRPGQRQAARTLGASATDEADSAGVALRWQVTGLLRESLWDIVTAGNAVGLAEESVDIAAELVRVVARRREAGDLALADELLARAMLLERQMAVIENEAELLDAERAYRSLTGLDTRPTSFDETRAPAEDFDATHPALALANAEIERTRAALALVEKQSRGTPSLTIGEHRQRDPLGTFYSNSVVMEFSLPVGGKRYGAVDRARAARAVAEAESQRAMVLRRLDLELHEAEHQLFVVEESLDVAMERAALADRQWQMGQTAFEQGELDLRDLLRIQESAQTARREVARLEIQRRRSIAMLNQALGDIP